MATQATCSRFEVVEAKGSWRVRDTARGETVAKATDEDWAYLIAEALAGQATCKGADEL